MIFQAPLTRSTVFFHPQNNPARSIKNQCLLFSLLLFTGVLAAQTNWTGAVSTDWAEPGNWTAGVPDANDNVTIPDLTNDPVIAASGALAKSVQIATGAMLTVQAGASLSINALTTGLINEGTLENYGLISIGETFFLGNTGLENKGTFHNKPGAELKIDQSLMSALVNSSTGVLNNAAKITIGSIYSAGNWGINNAGTCSNTAGGEIRINKTNVAGLTNSGTFTNNAAITIGAAAGVGNVGLENAGTFSNAAGEIWIDRCTTYGLDNGGSFTNTAKITIGAGVNVGLVGLLNRSACTFQNNAGEINIDRSSTSGLENGGTFTNAAKILVGQLASVGNYGIDNRVNAVFNNTGGEIKIDRSVQAALYTKSTFTNAANIFIGQMAATVTGYGIYTSFNSTFNNNTGAEIRIDRSSSYALYIQGSGGFNNAAKIIIGAVASIGTFGIYCESNFTNSATGDVSVDRWNNAGIFLTSSTFFNYGKLTVGAIPGSVSTSIYIGTGVYNNYACAETSVFARVEIGFLRLTNQGLLRVNTTIASTCSGMDNFGIIEYPQGNPIPNVANKRLIVNPFTTACSGSPALQISGSNNFTIGTTWYSNQNLTVPVGTFNLASNTFTWNNTPANGTYTVYFSVNDPTNGCARTVSAAVTVVPPVPANAGTNQTICSTSGSATMAGNTPNIGTGTWTKVSGPAGGTITSPNLPTTTITGLTTEGTYVFQWTIANPGCPTNSSQVSIIVKAPPTASNAGSDATLCGLTTALAGNTPATGTGSWTLFSGPGTANFANANSATTSVTVSTVGAYTFRWTIANAPCAASTDDVLITFTPGPTTANAGGDQTICATAGSATMAGNTPVVGTGAWSQVSGPAATITTPGSPTTTITGMTTAGTYVFKWSIANAPCTPSEDQVSVLVNAPPTASNAGSDATLCGLTTALAGNTPATGTGTWTLFSGPGTANFANASSATTSVTVSTVGAYTFRWTIANTPCATSADDVIITFTTGPTTANAGPDQADMATCGLTQVTLAANTPAAGTGMWSIQSGSGGSFDNANNPVTTFHGTAGSTYTLVWTISNAPCSASTDAMIVAFNQPPSFAVCPDATTVHVTSGCSIAATYAAAAANTTPSTTVTYSFSGATSGNGNGTGSGSTFNLGATNVSLTATNSCGVSHCYFTVEVLAPEINLQGNAIDIAEGDDTPSPADHTDFGQSTGASIVRTFTIQNTGEANLPIANITFAGAGAGMFSAGPLQPAGPIAPGNSATFDVTYTSNVTGIQTATVHIANGDCDEPVYSFAVQGELTCTTPAFTSCPTSISASTEQSLCSTTATYTTAASGIPAPVLTYVFTGATTGSGSGSGSGSAFDKGVTNVVVTATNSCGSATCSFTVTVADNELPAITCPNAITVTCASLIPAVNLGSVTAIDNCGTPVKTHVGDVASSMTCTNRLTVTRTYRATDGSNHTKTCAQIITVFDDVKPNFISVPANVTVQCSNVPVVGNATASDGCGGVVTVVYNGQTAVPGACPDASTITRQWTATDACGNTKTATQRIVVTDTQKPNFTSPPANITVQCDAIPDPATPAATDNCDTDVAITYVGQTTTAGACPNAYTITRRWVASDNCNNTRSISQRITVVDNGKPVFTSFPASTTIACNETPPAVGSPTASDGCGSATVTYLGQTTTSGNCPGNYQINRIWRATDACGNTTVVLQTIQVADTDAPVFTTVPPPVTIACNQFLPPLTNPTATDACGGYTHITFLGQTATGSGCTEDYTVTRTWRAADLCGNTATATQVITVLGNNFGEEGAENREQSAPLKTQHSKLVTVNPNPTTDRIWLDLTDYAGEAVTVSIFSDLGQLVWEYRIPAVEDLKLSVSLREAGATAGIYTVSLRSANGTVAKRIVMIE